MSPPRPEFTVRQLMVAVALTAALLGVGRVFFLAVLYARISASHHRRELAARDRGEWGGRMMQKGELAPAKKPLARDVADYHAALKEKYRRASASPWFPLSADPPDPERP